MNRTTLLVLSIVAVATAICASGCGRGDSRHNLVSAYPAMSGGANDIVSEGFTLNILGNLNASSFRLEVSALPDGEIAVAVLAASAENLPYALFELLYDSQKYKPSGSEFTGFFGTEDVITAAITTKPGNVGLAVVPAYYNRKPGISGSGNIVTITFKNEPFRSSSVGRLVFEARETPILEGYGNNPPDLDFTGLHWREVLVGDGDFSGEVNVADITPIALNYQAKINESPGSAFADYDENGEVGISDITPIALNYLSTLGGYKVYRDTTPVFNLETAVFDGVLFYESALENPRDAGGYLQHYYEFAFDPEGINTWFFFAIPFDAEGVESLNCISEPLETYTVLEIPFNRLNSFTISVTGDLGFENAYESGAAIHTAEFIANGKYTFDITKVMLELWNEEIQNFDPEIPVYPGDDEWDPAWESSIEWSLIEGSLTNFSFDKSRGNGAIGTCGPDNPFSFKVNAELWGRFCKIEIIAGIDPEAPEFVAVTPSAVAIPDLYTREFRLYCNMNDDGGTSPPQFWLIPQYGGQPIEITYNGAANSPQELNSGQFYIAESPNEIYGTNHEIVFKGLAYSDYFRMRAKNRLGRVSSLRQPPLGGEEYTNLMIFIGMDGDDFNTTRVYPIAAGGASTRLTITNSAPRIQLYPSKIEFTGDGKYRNYAMSSGTEFVPYRRTDTDPPYMHDAPWVRIYIENPFNPALVHPQNPLGFDSDVPYIASTAIPETDLAGGTARYLTDWGVADWCRVMVDVGDDEIIPPGQNYYIAVFQLPSDWENKIAVGSGEFRKVSAPEPVVKKPEVVAFAEIHSAFRMASVFPFISYANPDGVVIDYSNPVSEFPALLFVVNGAMPSVYHNNNPEMPGDAFRAASVKFTRDQAGEQFLLRVVQNETPGSEVFLSMPKSPHQPTFELPTSNPLGYVPPPPPDLGDPEVLWDDNDPGWMVLPLTEFDLGIVFGLNPRAYVSVGNWDFEASGPDRWIDSEPHYAPITVIGVS